MTKMNPDLFSGVLNLVLVTIGVYRQRGGKHRINLHGKPHINFIQNTKKLNDLSNFIFLLKILFCKYLLVFGRPINIMLPAYNFNRL